MVHCSSEVTKALKKYTTAYHQPGKANDTKPGLPPKAAFVSPATPSFKSFFKELINTTGDKYFVVLLPCDL